MYKKTVVLGLMMSMFGVAFAKADVFDDCIKEFGAKKAVLGHYEHAICTKKATAQVLAEVQQVYTKIANDKYYTKWNNGNGMFKGRVRDTYNAWLVYRNNYCDLLGLASKNDEDKDSESYYREVCRLEQTKNELAAIKSIIDAQLTDTD